MAVSFNRLSYWLWGTKDPESTNSGPNASSDFPSGFRELDFITFPAVNVHMMRPSSRRYMRKWQSRDERRARVDREYDAVIVPSDGGCLSGSDSDDSDWSIGWMEPHSSDFQSESKDSEDSFAVLVPCYGTRRCTNRSILKGHVLGAATERSGFSFDSIEHMDRWLSSLQDM